METIQEQTNRLQFTYTEEQQKIIDNENKVLKTFRPYCYEFEERVSLYEMACRFAQIFPLEKVSCVNLGVFARRCGYTYYNFQRVVRANDGTKYYKRVPLYVKGISKHTRKSTLRSRKAYNSDTILLDKQSKYKGSITHNPTSCPFKCFIINKLNQ